MTDQRLTDEQIVDAVARLEAREPTFQAPPREALLDRARPTWPAAARRHWGAALVPLLAAAAALVVAVGTTVVIRHASEPAAGPSVRRPAAVATLTPAPTQLPATASGRIADCDQRQLPVTVWIPRTSYRRGEVVALTVQVSNPGPLCRTTLLNPAGMVVTDSRHAPVYTSCTPISGNEACTGDLPVTTLTPGQVAQTTIAWDTTALTDSQLGIFTLERFGLRVQTSVSK